MVYSKLELKEIRKRLGKTQTEFGKMLGVGLRIVQRWEKGERNISKASRMLLTSIVSDAKEVPKEVPKYDPQPLAAPLPAADSTIGERLKEIMIQKGLNYRSLSDLIGYSDVSVGKIIKGQNKPKYEAIKKVMEVFPDIEARWLILGQGSMYVKPTSSMDMDSYHPLEIVEYIDKKRNEFSDLILFKRLIKSFVDEGIIVELEK